MKSYTVVTALVGAALVNCQDLTVERMGGIFSSVQAPGCEAKITRDIAPAGKMEDFGGGVQAYVAQSADKKTDTAILYLSDIFGLPLVNNKLLADSFAKAGYLVVAPDLFKGDAIPVDKMGDASFNKTAWNAKHTVADVEAIIDTTIKTMKSKYAVKQLGAVGYCFGGKYVTRLLAKGKPVDVGFTAHPSGVTKEELLAVDAPISIAYADNDKSNSPEQRDLVEETFYKSGIFWESTMYSYVEHGFGIRVNMSDSRQVYAQESAYLQATKFFDHWLR